MEKFAVNYNDLQGSLAPKPEAFRYADVKHRLKKVAYDIVRFVDGDDISGLWQIQETTDGDVIVAKYDDTVNFAVPVEKTASVETNWRALADRSGAVHIFYKDSPVTKVSLASIGIPADDADIVCRYLPEKLASNEALASNLLVEMPSGNLKELVRTHPELASMAKDPTFKSPKCQLGDPLCSDIEDKLKCGCPTDCHPCRKAKSTKGKCASNCQKK